MVELNPSSRSAARVGPRRKSNRRPVRIVLVGVFTLIGSLVVLYIGLVVQIVCQNNVSSSIHLLTSTTPKSPPRNTTSVNGKATASFALLSTNNKRSRYSDWKDLAVDLASKPAEEILSILRNQDPFGVRRFEELLLQTEANRRAILRPDEIKTLFPCPTNDRITLPDQRDHERGRKYRAGLNELTQDENDFVFLFFQHLRKAGGTNFCTLAQHNLMKPQVPPYYCMPDMYWDKKNCAGCFLRYTNEVISSRMLEKGYRILGNEWDHFAERFFELPAIFATSFRRPLDRALSQFRFECIEDRGCKFKEIEPWWQRRKDLTNVYTWTFSAMPIRKISAGTTMDDARKRQEAIGKALDTVARYNLVMVMEWLAYAPDHVKDILGFQDTSTMTERIRPHINQAKRDDGQDQNELGAAGIAKASWTPENYLSREQYKIMSEDLALDEILTDAARRMFLERIVCEDMAESKFVRGNE